MEITICGITFSVDPYDKNREFRMSVSNDQGGHSRTMEREEWLALGSFLRAAEKRVRVCEDRN